MSGASPVGPEMQLICDSIKRASARIRFFRIAFGAASDDPVVRNEVTSILTEMFDDGCFLSNGDPWMYKRERRYVARFLQSCV